MDVRAAIGYKSAPYKFSYSCRDTCLYNLAVGVSTADKGSLKFLYEGHPCFAPLPSFGVLPGLSWLDSLVNGGVPGLTVELNNVLHGEQFLQVYKPLQGEGELTNVFTIQDMLDKGSGSGMVLIVGVESKNAEGEVVLFNQVSLFIVGGGGWGGPRSSSQTINVIKSPSRDPDTTVEYQTSVDQAALYRLSGDYNPLHISSEAAALLGFKTPILHGLCSLGIAVRQILSTFAGNDPAKISEVKVRMSKPVIPGQRLRTDMWLEEEETILFQTVVLDTGDVCLSGGWAKLRKLN